MPSRWQLAAGSRRPFALTQALDKLEVLPGSPVTFRQLIESETGRTCHELIVVDRLPVGVDLSWGLTLSDMLDRIGARPPDEQVGDADQEVRLIRVSPDCVEGPIPVAVVAYASE
jgi:hypothetical protein